MDENNVVTSHNSATSPYAIPFAIVIAGLAISAAVYFGNNNKGVAALQQGTAAPQAINLDPVVSTDHIIGNLNAKIIIVEYSDLECPFCQMFHKTMNQIMNEYGKDGQVAWVYRHFPLPMHTKSPKESEAAECANKLGGNTKFWEFVNRIFDVGSMNNSLDPAELSKTAGVIGLDVSAFDACLSGGTMKSIIDASLVSGQKAGVQGTPHSIVLVNNKVVGTIDGAQPYEAVKAAIDSALK